MMKTSLLRKRSVYGASVFVGLVFVIGLRNSSSPLGNFLRSTTTSDHRNLEAYNPYNPNHNDLLGRLSSPTGTYRVLRTPERQLMLSNDALGDYYYVIGHGECLDEGHHHYDRVTYSTVGSADTCATKCGERVLLIEHRGFIFDTSTQTCSCLYDNGKVPFPLKQKASSTDVADISGLDEGEFGGGKVIKSADPEAVDVYCYAKVDEPVGASPLYDYYQQSNNCSDANTNPILIGESDAVVFDGVPDVFACGKLCVRYHLMLTHIALGYNSNTGVCDCYFESNESPRPNKIVGSGAQRITQQGFGDVAERHGQHLTCYSKKAIEQAPPEKRVDSSNLKVWINEFHYRNEGEDKPFIEIIGKEGLGKDNDWTNDLQVIFYQGRNGKEMKNSHSLSGMQFTENPINGWAFLPKLYGIGPTEIRSGKEGGDGIALINSTHCLQFISYAHNGESVSFEAKEGMCAGYASTPIGGISEDRKTQVTESLQLQGTGNKYGDFVWAGPMDATQGQQNIGQTLTQYYD